MSRLTVAAAVVPAVVGAVALGAATLVADAERDAAEEARSSHAAMAAAHELERAAAHLELGAYRFAITGRPAQLGAYRAARRRLEGLDPRVDAFAREQLDPVVALARRDRRDARIAIARGDVRAEGDLLRSAIHAGADAGAARAAAADERAARRADDLRVATLAGAAATLALALVLGLALWLASRRARRAGVLARRRLAAFEALASVTAAGGGFDAVLRAYADALDSDAGALHARSGDGPLRLVAVRALDGRALGEELHPGEGLPGRAAAERRTVTATYDDTTLIVRAHDRDVAVRHELHVPLMRAGRVAGVVTLARLAPLPFADDDRRLAEALAPAVAAALDSGVPAAPDPPPHNVDLVRLTRESVEAARPGAAEQGVEISLGLESIPPCPGDADRISLALDEIVARAIEAAGAGGRVEVRLFPRADVAVVELSVHPGRGPELDLARSVFGEHGGAVAVEGPAGGVTAFRVELPLRADAHAQP